MTKIKKMSLKDNIKKDLDVFFNIEEFAKEVSINSSVIKVIFKDKSDVVFNNELHTNIPTAVIKREDCKDIKAGDVLIVDEKEYVVSYIQHKDSYISELYLSEDSRNRF